MWLAGGGIKGGYIHGATDEFGHKAVLNPVSPNDYQTTLLHLFGLDPQKLIYFHNRQAASPTIRDRSSRTSSKKLDTDSASGNSLPLR